MADAEPLFQIGDHVASNVGAGTGIRGTIAGIKNIRQVQGPDEITYLIMYDGGDGEKAWWPELTLTLVPPVTE